jgi:hypothetical protein
MYPPDVQATVEPEVVEGREVNQPGVARFESGKGRGLFPFRELPPRVVGDLPRGCDEGDDEADLNEDGEGESSESLEDPG